MRNTCRCMYQDVARRLIGEIQARICTQTGIGCDGRTWQMYRTSVCLSQGFPNEMGGLQIKDGYYVC